MTPNRTQYFIKIIHLTFKTTLQSTQLKFIHSSDVCIRILYFIRFGDETTTSRKDCAQCVMVFGFFRLKKNSYKFFIAIYAFLLIHFCTCQWTCAKWNTVQWMKENLIRSTNGFILWHYSSGVQFSNIKIKLWNR